MTPQEQGIETRCVHAGVSDGARAGNLPIQPSVVQSTIFDLGASEDAEAIFAGQRAGYAYSRFGNPTVSQLAKAVAALEGGEEALVTSSGNAATLFAVAACMDGRSGPLVTHRDVYGGSFELVRILTETFRVSAIAADAQNEAEWLEAVSKAGAVLLETPSNPLMRLIDIRATVEVARERGAPVIVDNTVATPFNQQPLSLGADWVVHSTTKFINGHSDVVGGCAVKGEKITGREKAIHKNLGGTVNAIDAWLTLRGLRTFALRMKAHNRNGQQIAEWLRERPKVKNVYYPGFEDHPQSAVSKAQMREGGALLSVELNGGEAAAKRFLDRLQLFHHAVSLGGIESLAIRPAMSSHRGMPQKDREAAGVTDGLVRLSVGIEAPEDLIRDLEQALEE